MLSSQGVIKTVLVLLSALSVGLLSSCADVTTEALEELHTQLQQEPAAENFNISARSYYYVNYSSGNYNYGYHQNYDNPTDNPAASLYGSSYGSYNSSPYTNYYNYYNEETYVSPSTYSQYYEQTNSGNSYTYNGNTYTPTVASYHLYDTSDNTYYANPVYAATYDYAGTPGQIQYWSGNPYQPIANHTEGLYYFDHRPYSTQTGSAWCGVLIEGYGCTYQ